MSDVTHPHQLTTLAEVFHGNQHKLVAVHLVYLIMLVGQCAKNADVEPTGCVS